MSPSVARCIHGLTQTPHNLFLCPLSSLPPPFVTFVNPSNHVRTNQKGSGGGPAEDNVTGFLVRSIATNWAKGSVLAVDAGTHLAAIARILQESSLPREPTQAPKYIKKLRSFRNGITPSERPAGSIKDHGQDKVDAERKTVVSKGPFAGLKLPFESVRANAAYITRELVSTYLITHPHLDHISGFIINTASFQHTARPKRLAALSSTIDAIKTHIFNDVIWPNLSDEEGGIGLVSYMRLVEGGNVAIGEGEGRGYIEVCEGIGVKSWTVSHGSCMKTGHLGGGSSSSSLGKRPDLMDLSSGTALHMDLHRTSASSITTTAGSQRTWVYDSTAYFIRDEFSGKEILIFGDVEPDRLSLTPRTARVWDEAAPKIAAGILKGIFIECSYDDSQPDETLFGHLAPRHLMDELRSLAQRVRVIQGGRSEGSSARPSRRKRKRREEVVNGEEEEEEEEHGTPRQEAEGTYTTRNGVNSLPTRATHHQQHPPLRDLQIIIIHMKDSLKDGPRVETTILEQLLAQEEDGDDDDNAAGREILGCRFVISKSGDSIWL